MRLATIILTSSLMALACGSAKPTEPVRDPAAEKRLSEALGRRDELEKQYRAVAVDMRTTCEARAGDCLLEVGDRRADFLDTHSVATCRSEANSDLEARCVARTLPALGKADAASDYFAFEGRCFEQLLKCTAGLETKAEDKARLARIRQRMQELQASTEATRLSDAIDSKREKVTYLRGTLPPAGEGICKEFSDISTCEAKAEAPYPQLEEMLGRDDAEYDKPAATKLYLRMLRDQSTCRDPEFKCLMGKLAQFGETNETRHWLDQNLAVLDQRQELVNLLSPEIAQGCLNDGVAKYQSRIIQGYKQYAREPVMFFRAQLHRAFLALHKDQVACLSSKTASHNTLPLGG
jgi:hypothetical protein